MADNQDFVTTQMARIGSGSDEEMKKAINYCLLSEWSFALSDNTELKTRKEIFDAFRTGATVTISYDLLVPKLKRLTRMMSWEPEEESGAKDKED